MVMLRTVHLLSKPEEEGVILYLFTAKAESDCQGIPVFQEVEESHVCWHTARWHRTATPWRPRTVPTVRLRRPLTAYVFKVAATGFGQFLWSHSVIFPSYLPMAP